MAVICSGISEQGLTTLVRLARFIRQEQKTASNHLIFSCNEPFLDEGGMLRRTTRTIDIAELHSEMGGFYQWQTIGFDRAELINQRLFTPAPVDDGSNTFERLARQFEKIDLRLYWLNEPSVLVSAPRLGMSLTLLDLRTAKAYLAQVTEQTA